MPINFQDHQCMLAIQKGDKEAFGELLNRYQKPLYNFCWHMVLDQAVAEDIVQEVFKKLWQFPHHYKANNHATFKTWLFQIAKNQAIDLQRKDNHTVAVDEIDNSEINDDFNPTQTALISEESKKQLYQSLKQLSIIQRNVISLFYFEHHSQKEIATLLNLSIRQVEGHLYRARHKLQLSLM